MCISVHMVFLHRIYFAGTSTSHACSLHIFVYICIIRHCLHQVCSESAQCIRFCVSFQSFITCLVRWGRCEYLSHATTQQSWGISCSKHWTSWWQAGPRLSLGVGLFLIPYQFEHTSKRSKKGCTLARVEDVTTHRKRSWLTVVVGCACLLQFCNSSGHCSSFVDRHQRHQDSSSSLSFHGVFFSRKRLANAEFLFEETNAVLFVFLLFESVRLSLVTLRCFIRVSTSVIHLNPPASAGTDLRTLIFKNWDLVIWVQCKNLNWCYWYSDLTDLWPICKSDVSLTFLDLPYGILVEGPGSQVTKPGKLMVQNPDGHQPLYIASPFEVVEIGSKLLTVACWFNCLWCPSIPW